MRLTLRQKMNCVAGTVTAAFIILIGVNWYLNAEVENHTALIRDQFIPHVELGYRLETQFEAIALRLRDAVSAQDMNELNSTAELGDKLMNELDSASGIIEPQQIALVKTAIDEYLSIAVDTSKRIIQGETGLSIVEAMEKMQTKQTIADSLINRVAKFDRAKLSEAFTSIGNIQTRSAKLSFWVSIVCVGFIFGVSFVMGRVLIVRLREIANGVTRFGEGKFSRPIPIVGDDELSELSGQINKMANRIQTLVHELESFSYSVAHDLRAPLRAMVGFSNILVESYANILPEEGKTYLERIVSAGSRMEHMVDGLLNLSRMNRRTLSKQQVNLSKIASNIVELLRSNEPGRVAVVQVEENISALGDPQLLDIALANLIGNAWKFTKHTQETRIQFGCKKEKGSSIFFIRDNGAGFDMRYKDKLFGTFQRLHGESEFEGYGIGLATVKNIIDRHGGQIWAESEVNKGTTFYFTLA